MKIFIVTLCIMALSSFTTKDPANRSGNNLAGAWQWKNGNEIHTVIFSEQHYALTEYNVADKTFTSTRGGSWRSDGKAVVLLEEFNTVDKDAVGRERKVELRTKGNSISVALSSKDNKAKDWSRLDSGQPGKLAGAWLITGRMVDDNMQSITPGVRRTMKILSGTRFQWIAYNTETKEFFGTGGGTYTTKDGKYTENIDFFSRDNSRVGQSLQFDYALEDGKWRHKGLSSKGDPIDEVWTKREQLGI